MPKLFDIKHKIIADIRVELLDEFSQNFIRKGFFDNPWTPRKRQGGPGSLMNVTGRGSRSIRAEAKANSITFSTDTSYMKIHNTGGVFHQKIRAHTRKGKAVKAFSRTIKMPQRQFIGDHTKVRTAVRQIIDDNMQRAFRDLASALKPR